MRWQRTLEHLGQIQSQQGSEPDPFEHLVLQTQGTPTPPAVIRVTFARSEHVTMGAGNEAWLKCDVSVSIACPQRESYMDVAAELAAKKALEYTNDGMSLLGLPRTGDEG